MTPSVDVAVGQLTSAQCRRLLKIGMPFDWHPSKKFTLADLQGHVRGRLHVREITLAQVSDALNPKPRSNATTKVCRACLIRDRGQVRVPSITVYPNGTVSVRLLGNQRAEITTIEAVYHMAVKQRVAAERGDKDRAKKAKKKGGLK